ncbi:MAG: LPS export ABC transporter periplasmic protein LptC [Brumimicrobium sp.]|nr:LPS export ABC transporter periplasmic protein LptC [Brumimicrobium sp.]
MLGILILRKLFIPVMLVVAGIFFSCENDLEKIKKITTYPDSPNETTENLHVVYTDSGYAQVELFARIAESYSEPKSITKFKDGLKVKFFNEKGEVTSVLTSLYGEIDDESGNIIVRDSVELLNINRKKKLETEVLFWNKKGDSIYTDKAVVITSPDMILYGMGAWTNHRFDTAQFYKPTARIFLNNNE